MRLILFVVSLFLSWTTVAQIDVHPQRIAFGEFTESSDRVVDIIVKNNGTRTDFLLRSTFSHEFEVLFSDKKIEPGGQITIRIQFNPRAKGKLQEVAELYFASMTTPVQIPITADVQYVNVNGNMPCPDFSQRIADCCAQNFFFVEIYDAETKKPIEGAIFKLEEEGYLHLKLRTNKDGKVSNEARIGFYELIASAEGYISQRKDSYVNFVNSRFVFYLERDASLPANGEEDPELPEEEITADLSEFLPESAFKPNNVVFLLDISGSMGTGDKLDLMKLSLNELIGILRDVDRMALISYANNAQVLVPTSPGSQREEVLTVVEGIKTGGKTSGAKGFRKSFQLLKKSKIEEGNNQLIVITDGAFAAEDQKAIEKLVKQAANKGFKTTLVAIQANSFAKDKLGLVSQLGNGSFLQIEDKASATVILVDEVRKQSAR